MKISKENSTHWSHDEWNLINVTEIFKHKPAILKKAESYLEELRSALADELKTRPKSYPPDTDLTKGQIARGENHKGFPFLSLDIPQKFSKTEFFTYRTLFWWGHYLGFSLLLKGPELNTYLTRLKEHRHDTACENVYLSQHTSPWEWEFSGTHFTKVSELSKNEIQEVADRLQYLKLMRFFPVSEKSFPELNWTQAGVQSFRDLVHLVLE
ncbi:MAG: hypothetical protein V3R14_03815 [Nitrospinaceae bacterium]